MNDIPKYDVKRAEKLRNTYNTLVDKPETVTEFLGEKILKNKENGNRIAWLISAKAAWRFSTSKILKRDIFK